MFLVFNGLEFNACLFNLEILFLKKQMKYLSGFRLTLFPLLLLYCSNKVNLENNGTLHQFVFKQILCITFSITYTTACRLHTRRHADYIDNHMTITSLVLTLACCMLECSMNKSLLWNQNAVSLLMSV